MIGRSLRSEIMFNEIILKESFFTEKSCKPHQTLGKPLLSILGILAFFFFDKNAWLKMLTVYASIILPWWLRAKEASSLLYSLKVMIQTSRKGIRMLKMSQISTILIYDVGGSFSITLMKMVVNTSIVVTLTVKAASKKNDLKKVVQ